MKLPLKWLNEYIDINNISPKEYCDKMTYSGSKVEGYENISGEIKNVVIGKLLSVEKHPDADKLSVCKVDVGREEILQIVTGATNVKAGDIIPVALHRSVLHGGKEITKGKLRGVASEGMLCSLEELGLTKHDFPYADEDGILVLRESDVGELNLGDDVKKALSLEDTVIEFEITPNRADCYSVIGLARESAATFDMPLNLPVPTVKNADKSDNINKYLSVEIKNNILCPRYTARVVKDIKIAASPLWLRARLRSCGIRPINNIVDITNLVMLEYGQPMHAFDYSFISGQKIQIRNALKDEKIVTLDSAERNLTEDMLVIADESKAIALAGVMGGENSEIKDTTTTIVFESANFDKMSVRHTSKKVGLRTDSSASYEKGLDPYLTLAAIDRACELVEMLNCGTVVAGTIDEYKKLPEKTTLTLDTEKINALLGTDISNQEMIDILSKLDFTVTQENEVTRVIVPTYRSDVELSADLAEEVCRIYGYNNIKRAEKNNTQSSSFNIQRGGRSHFQKFLRKIHNMLLGDGCFEIYTLSFVSPKSCDKINLPKDSALRDSISLINPLGEDTSVMRTTLLPSMLNVLSTNCTRNNAHGYFYELSKVYFTKKENNSDSSIKGKFAADEKNKLAIGFYDAESDFYSLKGIVENVLAAAGIAEYNIISDISDCELAPAFHPGRCAKIISTDANPKIYGVFGEVHPLVAENFEIDKKDIRCCVAEFDIDLFYASYQENNAEDIKYAQLPKYPLSSRDLALICDEDMEAAKIYDIIKTQSGKIFESAKVFDVYKGLAIGDGKKSLAFEIVFRSAEHTLNDGEVNIAIENILNALGEIGVTLRK